MITLILNKAKLWMIKIPLLAKVIQSAHIAFTDCLFQSNTRKLSRYGRLSGKLILVL